MFAKSSNSEERSFKAIDDSFARYVSPLWVEILTVLGINRQCERPIGAEFFKAEGDCSSDFLGGIRRLPRTASCCLDNRGVD